MHRQDRASHRRGATCRPKRRVASNRRSNRVRPVLKASREVLQGQTERPMDTEDVGSDSSACEVDQVPGHRERESWVTPHAGHTFEWIATRSLPRATLDIIELSC